MEEEMRSESVAGAGRRHWSVRPGMMFLFLLAVRFLITMVILSLNLFAPTPALSFEGFRIVIGVCSIMISMSGSISCFILVRKVQRKHGLQSYGEWNVNKTFWAGVALLAVYVAILIIGMNRISSPGLILLNYSSNLATQLADILLFFLLLPLLEKRGSIVGGALLIGALAAASVVINRLLSFVWAVLQMHMMDWGDAASIFLSASALVYIVSGFAIGVLTVMLYRLSSRRVPGAWALYTAVAGFVGILFSMLVGPLRAGPPEFPMKFYVIYVACYLGIALLAIGVLTGSNRWNSFSAFASGFRAGINKLRGMQDDGET